MTWKEIAHRRLRLWWAGLIIGLIAGFILALITTAPPTWISTLPGVHDGPVHDERMFPLLPKRSHLPDQRLGDGLRLL